MKGASAAHELCKVGINGCLLLNHQRKLFVVIYNVGVTDHGGGYLPLEDQNRQASTHKHAV